MATHSSTLAWKIPQTEEPGRLQSMGSHRVGHDWSDLAAAAEGYGNQYWPIRSSILAWRNPLTKKPGRRHSTGSQRVGHNQSDPACIDLRLFACGSSAPVRVEHEGGAAAWFAGTLAAPSVQGHGLPLPQELWTYQSLLLSLSWLVLRRPLGPVFLCSSALSGT